jgi:oligopeptidase B
MLGRVKQTDLSVPVRHGDYLYYSRTEEGKQYPIQCRRKGSMEASEEILLDLNELAKTHKFVGLGGFVVSDDHNMLAYTVDFTGFRQYGLQVKNLRTGETLPDTHERVDSLVWAADNKTLFLTTEDAVTKRSDKLWRHVVGTTAFEPIYDEKDELYDIRAEKTRDKKYDPAEQRQPRTPPNLAGCARTSRRASSPFSCRARRSTVTTSTTARNLFYIRTNKSGRNFAIMTAPESDPAPKNWKVFIPQRDDVLIEDLDLFQDFAVCVERAQALDHLRVYDFHSAKWTLPFHSPSRSTPASAGGTPEFASKTYRYNYQSFLTPPSVYDYDVRSGQSTLLKRQEVLGGYDPTQYVSERLWATARDGVKVPVSIVYRKGFVKDGRAPLFLYGYGSYGIGTPATFSSNRLSLLDRGMAYAIAHIRGGNEMGEKWREDGMLMKKKNTFWDFIDSAEYLIAQKWTSKDRLVIEGGSAGGLLMGAVVNMRPDLFHAVHAGGAVRGCDEYHDGRIAAADRRRISGVGQSQRERGVRLYEDVQPL